MGLSDRDAVPFARACSTLCDLADQAKPGAGKTITSHGSGDVASMSADSLDDDHPLERDRIHRLLLDDAKHGLADIAAGRTSEADSAIELLQKQRKANAGRGWADQASDLGVSPPRPFPSTPLRRR